MNQLHELSRSAAVGVIAVAFCSLVGLEIVREPSLTRLLTAVAIGLAIGIMATQQPVAAALVTLALLPFLALTRRLLLDYTAWNSKDPLLLVAPAVLGLLLLRVYVLEHDRLPTTRIAKLVAFLVFLSLLEALNPRGGGIAAGLTALLFTAVPLCWFFVGAHYGRRNGMSALLMWVSVAAGLVAVYGLVQTWDGLPHWDSAWVRQTGYQALNVGQTIRAFGTFSSAAEYGSFLAVGIVVAIAFALTSRPVLLPLVPLLAVALFYESSRGIIVTTLFAVLVVVAARTGNLRRAIATFSCGLAIVALGFVFGRGSLESTAQTSQSSLVSHQLSGLAQPLNGNDSTLSTHFDQLKNGFTNGVLDPFGNGIAATTLAGQEIGAGSASTEVDLSNVFVSYGTLGGFLYLAVVIIALRAALLQAVERRDPVALANLGVLTVLVGQWLNGGYYALSPLVWFVVGFTTIADLRDNYAERRAGSDARDSYA